MMNIQIYLGKKNVDTLKAERFFKERRIPVQYVDIKKHELGTRELTLFAQHAGVKALIDMESMVVRSHPVAYTNDPAVILEYLQRFPHFLRTPIVRNGKRITVGTDEIEWQRWVDDDRKAAK